MSKVATRTYSRYSLEAAALLGGPICAARKERRMTDRRLFWQRQFLNPFVFEE